MNNWGCENATVLDRRVLASIFIEGIAIVVYDNVEKSLGALSDMDYRHYVRIALSCFHGKHFPFVSQVHRFLRLTIFLENPWSCVNNKTKINKLTKNLE